jgi:hypothetical protein
MRLKNRKELKEKIGSFITHTVIPLELSKKLLEANIDDYYPHYLVIFQNTIQFIKDMKQTSTSNTWFHSTVSLRETLPEMARLRTKVAQRLKDFLVSKMKAMQSPTISMQLFQQEELLRYKLFYVFLTEHDTEMASEVRHRYEIYTQHYYIRFMEKYETHIKTLEVS